MRVAILDGYVDEPSCLGVPPYISPYPRYIYGMLLHFGVRPLYVTIDQLRGDFTLKERLKQFDILIIIAGIAVPGKYLGGKPLSKKEIFGVNFAKRNILVGPIRLELSKKDVMQLEDCGIRVLSFPFERGLFESLSTMFGNSKTKKFDLDAFSVLGAEVVTRHPDYPFIICEMETYRGCYWGKCSFCIERIHRFWMRDCENVIAEFKALYRNGVRYFRIGRQTDFLTYLGDFNREVPKPDPERLKAFHRAIWRECPGIRTLHLDNVNPKTLATYPDEAREIVKTIVTYQSPGNVAAMGLESADERVIEKNNLCANPEEVIDAIRMINEYGKYVGYNGLPYFLPGINFVIGLRGERKDTFERNMEFLKEILDQNLLLRRINIRQVKIFPDTPMEKVGYRILEKHKRYFRIFKKRVREEVDNIMLQKILPRGRKITDLRCEVEGKVTYARQLATYPILVGLIGRYRRNTVLDARVVDYGYRSVTAIETPLNVNTATVDQIKSLPLPKKVVKEIISKRPFRNQSELKKAIPFTDIENYVCIA
jgi:radical SAM superfamily enzyme with C-terminal helix-hairpin-helix motif